MKKTLLLAVLLLCAYMSGIAQIYVTREDRERAEALVEQMTLQEKCALITGQDDGFHTAAIEHLGIPSVRMADGPQGVRNKTNSTYYPCGLSLAASFNRAIAHGVGTGIGWDASARGVRIMLCPGVNIYRSPLCGRNFEYYGEDPYLASETAVQYIRGIQEQRVIATIKHFALNNQEYNRHGTISLADERTINEIYFPTFRKAVEQAKVGAVMTSYNPVNGIHAPENQWLLGQLRGWGHEGIVMSDWTSTYTTLGSLTGGLDLEMPKGYVLNYEAVSELVRNGTIEESLVDEKCIHILQTFAAFGLLDLPMKNESIPENNLPSRQKAYEAALEGPVLLKNEGILPLKASKKNNIVVLGPNADIIPYGGGSGRMDPIEGTTTTLWQGIAALGKNYKASLMDWQNIDEAALAGGEDLFGLPEMLAPVVRLEADDVHRLDELVDRRHHGHAHLPHLCNVFRIAIGGREYVARPPLVGGRHAKALRPRRTVHVDDLRERDGVARVESDDADARLGDRAEDGKKRRSRHGHDLAVRATSGWRLPHSTPFPSFAAAGGSRNIVQSG